MLRGGFVKPMNTVRHASKNLGGLGAGPHRAWVVTEKKLRFGRLRLTKSKTVALPFVPQGRGEQEELRS